MTLTAFNYSRFRHVYDVYGGVNRNINKKERCNIKIFLGSLCGFCHDLGYRAQVFLSQSESLAKFENLETTRKLGSITNV